MTENQNGNCWVDSENAYLEIFERDPRTKTPFFFHFGVVLKTLKTPEVFLGPLFSLAVGAVSQSGEKDPPPQPLPPLLFLLKLVLLFYMEPWETYQITIIIFDQNSNDDDNSVSYFGTSQRGEGKKLK